MILCLVFSFDTVDVGGDVVEIRSLVPRICQFLSAVLMQKTGLAVCTATVWTLSSNGRKKSTGTTISRRRRWPTSLFPWKRVSMALYLSRRRPLSEGKKGPSVFYLRLDHYLYDQICTQFPDVVLSLL